MLRHQIFPGVRSYLRDNGRGGRELETIPVHVSPSIPPMCGLRMTTDRKLTPRDNPQPAVRMFCEAGRAYERRNAASPTLGVRAAHHDPEAEDSEASDDEQPLTRHMRRLQIRD